MFRILLKMAEDIGWGRMLSGFLLTALCVGILAVLVSLISRWVQRRVPSRRLGLTVGAAIGLALGILVGILSGFLVQYVWKVGVYLEVSLCMGLFGGVFGLLLGVGWTGKGAKLGAAASCFILLGVFLMTEPSFRANPDTLSIEVALPGIGAILAGVVLVGLMVWSSVRRSPAPESKKEESAA